MHIFMLHVYIYINKTIAVSYSLWLVCFSITILLLFIPSVWSSKKVALLLDTVPCIFFYFLFKSIDFQCSTFFSSSDNWPPCPSITVKVCKFGTNQWPVYPVLWVVKFMPLFLWNVFTLALRNCISFAVGSYSSWMSSLYLSDGKSSIWDSMKFERRPGSS